MALAAFFCKRTRPRASRVREVGAESRFADERVGGTGGRSLTGDDAADQRAKKEWIGLD